MLRGYLIPCGYTKIQYPLSNAATALPSHLTILQVTLQNLVTWKFESGHLELEASMLTTQPHWYYYTSPGHSHWYLKVQVLEKVTPNTPCYRLEREEYWIKKFSTKIPYGLNKYD
jgi:hypothetical protein